MSYDFIKFLPEGYIEIPKGGVWFGSDQRLYARMFKPQNYEGREDMERHMDLYNYSQKIEEIWFDRNIQVVEDCVVVGRDVYGWLLRSNCYRVTWESREEAIMLIIYDQGDRLA
ncbi:uncharacterized protein PV09_09311 [Verruconis gallopava]|uniref:Uncharacterized protein n=1 Tax=Verruconis gallopava TaxID=253628 RepID=A0A0D1ZXW8_9PEZI|nr:uncharacterized protein PV09_09311 [Verruconis gallopava]KIV98924.1 hypothetical protein PV09_09311 [Verruconis gallopava]